MVYDSTCAIKASRHIECSKRARFLCFYVLNQSLSTIANLGEWQLIAPGGANGLQRKKSQFFMKKNHHLENHECQLHGEVAESTSECTENTLTQ